MRFLFGTSLARSGAGLFCDILSVHSAVCMAANPYLELYRSYRNAVVRTYGGDALSAVPPSAPLQDYYHSEDRLRVLDAILDANLDIGFDPAEWDGFFERCVARGNLDASDLAARFSELRHPTYRGMFGASAEIVARVRGGAQCEWAGYIEAWGIDMLPALARAFPEARFVILLRDPRATINSMLGMSRTFPDQLAQVLSYARHWRKYVAFCERYRADPLFAGRLHVLTHEQIVTQPEHAVGNLCSFLDIAFDPRMLNSGNFVQFAQQTGGGSFSGETPEGIDPKAANRWRTTIAADVLAVVEWLCGPDMKLAGYEPLTPLAAAVEPSGVVADFLRRESSGPLNWRSDLSDIDLDIACEIERKRLLHSSQPNPDTLLVRRCFLFPEIYGALRGHGARNVILSSA